jgi:subtilisin family serine protease
MSRPVPEERTGRVLVRFKPAVSRQSVTALAGELGATIVDEVPVLRVKVLRPGSAGAGALLERLRRNPNVVYAEPEGVVRAFATPNDPDLGRQWGHANIRSRSGWDISKGSPAVKVALVDTGISSGHVDLVGRYAAGYDFVRHDGTPNDENGHGTHVAGIAAATGNNGTGGVGVGWSTRLLVAKVLGADGSGATATVSEGIVWAADNGASVINLSLGSYDYSQTEADAVKYAQGKGALVVAAAGNEATNYPSYPVALPGVVGVAATDRDDTRAPFSNYGDYVDISAPGVDIYSTWLNNGYEYMSGTSMAAPFVAGAAAVLKAKFPGFTAGQLYDRLRFGADDIGARGKDEYTGYGRLNLFRALAVPGKAYGVVRNAQTGAPIAKAKVSLASTTRYVLTDAYGNYSMAGVPYGSQTLKYTGWGYQPYTNALWMPAGGAVQLNVSLQPSARLSGYVRTGTGAPLPGATVRIEGTARADTTDSTGYYIITNIPLGPHTATASKDGYASVSRSVTFTMGATSKLDFSLNPK